MIDHIEMLRDDANARDTRIRLTPDALGTVDVALRRDGDAVHVRFSSANEATRLVLNDAQPRLAALAEARGVRIAGSSIDSGTGGGGQPQPQPRAESPRPARATRGVATTETDIPGDQRLA
jgi:flagellar hook-length control protein FliK